jgi:hypothetical protein
MNDTNEELMPVVVSKGDDDDFFSSIDKAERSVNFFLRARALVFKITNSNDWVDLGGKPYLDGSGCHKVAGQFGISWRFLTDPKKVFEEDGHYRYDTTLELTLRNRSIEVMGSRSTKDKFYSSDKSVSEIDGGDILKASITNAQAIGISALLGLRNLTWEEVTAGGIKRGATSRVDYGDKAEMSEEAKDYRSKIGAMLLEMAGGNKEIASHYLVTYTSFVAKDGKTIKGKQSLADVSEKAMPVTYGKVEKVYNEWKAKGHVDKQEEFDEVPLDFDKE